MLEIKAKLLEIGVAPNNKGFMYLVYAIENYRFFKRMGDVVKEVSGVYGISEHRAERCMRHSSKKVFDGTLGEFIATMAVKWGIV